MMKRRNTVIPAEETRDDIQSAGGEVERYWEKDAFQWFDGSGQGGSYREPFAHISKTGLFPAAVLALWTRGMECWWPPSQPIKLNQKGRF